MKERLKLSDSLYNELRKDLGPALVSLYAVRKCKEVFNAAVLNFFELSLLESRMQDKYVSQDVAGVSVLKLVHFMLQTKPPEKEAHLKFSRDEFQCDGGAQYLLKPRLNIRILYNSIFDSRGFPSPPQSGEFLSSPDL